MMEARSERKISKMEEGKKEQNKRKEEKGLARGKKAGKKNQRQQLAKREIKMTGGNSSYQMKS